MAVTGRDLKRTQRQQRIQQTTGIFYPLAYGVTLLLAALAIYVLVGAVIERSQVLIDDIRYGRPRSMYVSGYVGHTGEVVGQPSQFIAMNLNRQVIVLQLPGGDSSQVRSFAGPYLFGADEDLTPVLIDLYDMDGDGYNDLVIDVRRERIIYLNRDGSFRLPTAEEQVQLQGVSR